MFQHIAQWTFPCGTKTRIVELSVWLIVDWCVSEGSLWKLSAKTTARILRRLMARRRGWFYQSSNVAMRVFEILEHCRFIEMLVIATCSIVTETYLQRKAKVASPQHKSYGSAAHTQLWWQDSVTSKHWISTGDCVNLQRILFKGVQNSAGGILVPPTTRTWQSAEDQPSTSSQHADRAIKIYHTYPSAKDASSTSTKSKNHSSYNLR